MTIFSNRLELQPLNMHSARGDVLDVLQWQNTPRPGSLDFANAKNLERQTPPGKFYLVVSDRLIFQEC